MPAQLSCDDALLQTPMTIPSTRGPVGAAVLDLLTEGTPLPSDLADVVISTDGDLLVDEDLQPALFVLYELHDGGLAGVADDLEWSPDLLRLRAGIEVVFEAALRAGQDRDPDGAPLPHRRRTVALCRCGRSTLKPSCDGTHEPIGFRTQPERPERTVPTPEGALDAAS